MQPVAGDGGVEPFLHQDPGALVGGVEHRGRLGVVVEPPRPPVVQHHGEIEVVGGDPHPPLGVAVLADPGLHMGPSPDDVDGARRETEGGAPGRPGEALLQAGGGRVDSPAVHLEGVAPQARGDVGVEQHVVPPADLADLGERLAHGGGRVPLHGGDELRAGAQDRPLHLRRVDDRPPRRLDGVHLGAASPCDLRQQVPEPPEDEHQHPVARFQQGDQRGLDPRPRRPVHEHGRVVAGAEHLPVQRLRLAHVRRHRGVVLPDEGGRHGPQDPRVGVDGTRPHQQSRRRVHGLHRLTLRSGHPPPPRRRAPVELPAELIALLRQPAAASSPRPCRTARRS